MDLSKACRLALGGILGGILSVALAACGPVTAQTIDCQDQAACGSHGTCDDSSGTARCLCAQGYARVLGGYGTVIPGIIQFLWSILYPVYAKVLSGITHYDEE